MNQTAAIVGGILVVGGIAGGAYAYSSYKRGAQTAGSVSSVQVTLSPQPLPAATTLATVTLGWTNPTSAAVIYGAQAAWLEEVKGSNGVIAGHLFNSQGLAQQALAQPSTAGLLVTNPLYRVATVTVPAGAAGSVNLYGMFNPVTAVGPFALAVWLVPNPPTSALLATDPTGVAVSRTTGTGRFISQVLETA